MKRRDFLAMAAAMITGTGMQASAAAAVQPTDKQRELFAGALGVAFRQYRASTNPEAGGYIEESDVTLYSDWYSVMYSDPVTARATFDEWAEWIKVSGNRYTDEEREYFPIGIYEAVQYGMATPDRNDFGDFDMYGSWNLEGEIGKPYLGHLGILQTGALISVQWLHANKPGKSHISWIGKQILEGLYPDMSANQPRSGDMVSDEYMLSLLPEPESLIFDDYVITSVEVEREWVQAG